MGVGIRPAALHALEAPAQPAWTAQRAYAVLVSPRNNLVQD